MQIAFVVSDYPVLSETFIIRQIRGLVDRGHEVTVIAGYYDAAVPDPLAGRITIKTIRQARSVKRYVAVFSEILRFKMRRWGPALKAASDGYLAPAADLIGTPAHLGRFDAILAHFGPTGVRAMFLRKAGLLEGPIATVFHGIDVTSYKLIARFRNLYSQLFAGTELFLPISQLWADKLLAWGAPPQRVSVHRMGTDIPAVSDGRLSRPVNTPLKVLSVGRLVEKKGIEFAIAAVSRLPDIEYTIVGAGPLENQLSSAAASRGAGSTIKMLGKRPHAETLRLLSESDVFLLPSVTASDGDMEGIPVSLMEAMADGVLVIATVHSGIPELIEDGVDGLLVPERDVDALTDVLQQVQSGKVPVVELRAAAYSKVLSKFDNDKLDGELETKLLRLAQGDPGATPSSSKRRFCWHSWGPWIGSFEPGEIGAKRVSECKRCGKTRTYLSF